MRVGRRVVVGNAAALWQYGRIYGAGAVLSFAGTSEGVRDTGAGDACCSRDVRRRVYVRRRCACDAGTEKEMADADRAVDGAVWGGGCGAYRRAAGCGAPWAGVD